MEQSFVAWLTTLSSVVVRVCLALFAVVNLGAIAAVVLRRDRALVQRWTAPWLATNAVLIGAGLGTPLLVGLTKLAIEAVASAGNLAMTFVK